LPQRRASWNETRGAEFDAAANGSRVVVGGDHDHRHAWILRAHIHKAGETAHARHRQIKRHKIDVASAFEQTDKLVECPGFGNFRPLQQSLDRFAQGTAKQRMVIGDYEPVLQRFIQAGHSSGLPCQRLCAACFSQKHARATHVPPVA